MISLHRLGHKLEPFRLNPDLIVTVEACPDTVITLATGAKIVVAETPERVAKEVRNYRVEILASALGRRHELRRGQTPHLAPPSWARSTTILRMRPGTPRRDVPPCS
jgi:flagellar protein FlbD